MGAVRQDSSLTDALRVGIYNRCSTEEEAQRNALNVQVQESREIAEQRKGWIVTAQYVESESGTSTRRRNEYQRLYEDMERDLFDIIMIKSIDRLMRSAKDWYLFLGRLTEYHLKLYIYIDDQFYTPDDSLISGIKAILAEEFSRELSKKIKNAHRRRQQKKTGWNITSPMFGWNKTGKNTFERNETEAEYYRQAFELALEGRGFYRIANQMYQQGARSRNGKKIGAVQWRKMLYSPRAHGTVVMHTKEYDFESKRYRQVPEEEWIYAENALPPIVSREYQEQVLKKIEERAVHCRYGEYKRDMSKAGMHLFSGKLYCGICGGVYYRNAFRSGQGYLVEWKCSSAMKYGRRAKDPENGCDNRNVREDQILELLRQNCEEHYEEIGGPREQLEECMNGMLEEILSGAGDEGELARLTSEYEKLEQKKKRVLEKLLSGVIGDDDFLMCRMEVENQMKLLEQRREKLKAAGQGEEDRDKRLEQIRRCLKETDMIAEAKVRVLVTKMERMEVYPDGRLEILLNKEQRRTMYLPEGSHKLQVSR